MRLLLTILAVLALPGAAFAQYSPQVMRGPVVAPNQAGNGFHGITVMGSATRSVPATRARVTLNLYARNPVINTKSVQPIVDALTKAGVPVEHIAVPPGLGSPASLNNAAIVVTIDKPTVDQMQSGIAAVGAAISSATDGISIQGAQVLLEADNCSETVDVVRGDAIRAARAKADQTAKDLQVHVGGVLNVTANDQMSASGTCSTQYYFGTGNSSNLTTPKDYVSVPVVVFVNITYAIKY